MTAPDSPTRGTETCHRSVETGCCSWVNCPKLTTAPVPPCPLPAAPSPTGTTESDCTHCGGSGAEPQEDDEHDERTYPCQQCNGTGETPTPVVERQQADKRDRYGHTEADHDAAGACRRPSLDARVAASATEYERGSDLRVAFERGWDAHGALSSPPAQPDTAVVERVAVALAEAMNDGCFHRSMYTEQEWENGDGEEYRQDYRRFARAALAAARPVPAPDVTALVQQLRTDGITALTRVRALIAHTSSGNVSVAAIRHALDGTPMPAGPDETDSIGRRITDSGLRERVEALAADLEGVVIMGGGVLANRIRRALDDTSSTGGEQDD